MTVDISVTEDGFNAEPFYTALVTFFFVNKLSSGQRCPTIVASVSKYSVNRDHTL